MMACDICITCKHATTISDQEMCATKLSVAIACTLPVFDLVLSEAFDLTSLSLLSSFVDATTNTDISYSANATTQFACICEWQTYPDTEVCT